MPKVYEDISSNKKKMFIQRLDSDRSVCISAICYSVTISAVTTNERLLAKKETCEKCQNYISKTEVLFRVYADGQTD